MTSSSVKYYNILASLSLIFVNKLVSITSLTIAVIYSVSYIYIYKFIHIFLLNKNNTLDLGLIYCHE